MNDKTSPNFHPESGPKLGGRSGLAGRPRGGHIPATVAGAVARLASNYLSQRPGPKSQLNMLLAGVTKDTLRGKKPADFIERLASRKSIPRIIRGNRFTDGLQSMEMLPGLQGTLQILYGTYVDLLTPRSSLEEVHYLISLSKYAQSSELFVWFRARSERNRRASVDELGELQHAMDLSKAQGSWRGKFLDFLAVAMGLFQEVVMTRDATGTRVWRDFLLGESLSFARWPYCSKEHREEMDKLVHDLANSAPVFRYDAPLAALGHIRTRVLDSESMREHELSVGFLVRLYLTIRDGGQSNAQDEARAISMVLTSLRLPEKLRPTRRRLLDQVKAFRKQR